MSFVDELNKQVSDDELLEAEDNYIKNYTAQVINAIKYSCLKYKTAHSLSGYYGKEWYADDHEILKDDQYCLFCQLKKHIVLDTRKKDIDLKKAKNVLSSEIEKLGFTKYQIELRPYRIKKEEKNIFGFKRTEYENTDEHVVWVHLEW